MHKDNYCAYHNTQIITTFCRCNDCLLPACLACVKLHSEEHQLNQTKPIYENMGNIFRQIQSQLNEFESRTKGLAELLFRKQKQRRQQMHSLREAINIKRKQVVDDFQNALRMLDQRIVKGLYQIDNDFISEIQNLDDEVLAIQTQLSNVKLGLKSEQSLRTVINYFDQSRHEYFQQKISAISDKITEFMSKQIQSNFSQSIKSNINLSLDQFISISEISKIALK